MHLPQASSSHSIVWQNIDLQGSEDSHAILRSGQHACVFDNYYETSRTMRIIDIETQKTIKRFRCELGESIFVFRFPYLVTRKEGLIKIWDASSDSREPQKVISTDLKGIQRGDIHGKTLVIISTQLETMQPKYITIIRDFERPNETLHTFIDRDIDGDSGLLIYNDSVLYSTLFGSLQILSLDDFSFKTIPNVPDVNAYLEGITRDNVEEYKSNIIRSLVMEGTTLAGSSPRAIKIWDVASCTLQREISSKREYLLLSLEGRFLFGVSHRHAKIWDIFSGVLLYKEKEYNLSACFIPAFTLFQNRMYHVGMRGLERADIVVEEPLTSTLEEQNKSSEQHEEEKQAPNENEKPLPKDRKDRCILS